jgi:hypothetical protein
MKAYKESGVTVPFIRNLGTIWSCGSNLRPRPLYPRGKITRYPSKRGSVGHVV